MHKPSQKQMLLVAGCMLLGVVIFIWSIVYQWQSRDELKVVFLDIGQGDAVYIESPSGVQVLIDGGPSGPRVLRQLGKVMPFYDRSIDMLVMSHPDTDHVGGLIDVLKRYEVDRVVRPGVEHSAPAIEALLRQVDKSNRDEGTMLTLARRGQVFDLGQGSAGRVELHILFPDRGVNGVESNAASIVARLVYGEASVMLTGDSPQAIEEYLVSLDGEALHSDILKLGHHGSKTSSAVSFLGFVSPDWAIVSAGIDNKYGHPHKEVLERVEQLGIPIKNTAGSGSITFVSNGREWVLE